ncbi:hypothetical protein RVX_R13720 [Nitratidesulfovibrio sp. HK-II]|jgi:hypothetical protein|uniref:hypothetical protein n=1 Tax=Nitratidesulfovibrio sp. HK-II TaxID=2009266 RepID=UPI000E2E9F00|nr:hypothetical protein [Nitratidesulfovibrio sp. HK-II]GBO95691.1 hypothetical protein RVX_0731 [Nitratidesulfovibrio sp. HK-II]
MAYVYSDISTFSGRRMLEMVLGQQVRAGARLQVTDEIIALYLRSLKIAEQYPTKVMTASQRGVPPEILRGLIASWSI